MPLLIRPSLALILVLLVPALRASDDDLASREESAMQAAVARVSPSVVSIETLGGLERVGQVLFGTGPTSGLIVSSDGYIVSSAFNFAQKPASILVELADGSRAAAEWVATDRNRMLVLLKIPATVDLPVPEGVSEDEMRVGQWSIAVGRAFDPARPNISVGIISALHRVWDKAIQTDAKISPANYGGPLVDIHGRVLGVLVPLSPMASGEVQGVEWYDSGIGFAVPLEQINRLLPRLKEGHDLLPGLLGVHLQSHDPYADAPVIAACRPNSPAYKAGFKAGDRVVQVDDRAIERQVQLMHEIHRRYAGDKLKVTVARGEERIERELELVDHLDPYQRPFLGILPRRDPAETPTGVTVRYVYPGSPAFNAGILAGDKLVSLAGQAIRRRDELVSAAAAIELNQRTPLEIERDGRKLSLEVVWSAVVPEAVPDELPAAHAPWAPFEGRRPTVGTFELQVPELTNKALAYVPAGYDPRLPHGLVVWFPSANVVNSDDELLAHWKDACERAGLLLLAPKPATAGRWQKDDLEFATKALAQFRAGYQVDPSRIVAAGHETGGTMAYALAFAERETIRGVAAIDAPLGAAPPDNDPVLRLDFFVTQAAQSKFSKPIATAIKALRERKFAVTVRDQGPQGHDLSDEDRAEMLEWIDTLDKI
ncbi:MAG TPA: PDZ domain-containing protein [Pirellulales bacterium]|nr:PDZ domain-containing protein [Pirellulales bacterium]